MKKSLRTRLFIYLANMTAMIVLFSWLMNSLFLERYYTYSKEKELVLNYWNINQLYNLDNSSLALELEKLQLNLGMQLVIFDDNLDAVYFAWQDTIRWGGRQVLIPGVPGLIDFMMEKNPGSPYEIHHNFDQRLKSHYVDLLGRLDNGLYVLLRTPIQSITESAAIANRFMLLTGLISILISAVVSMKLSSQVTQPIKELNTIAKSMAELDFTAKYEVKSEDEVGSLGISINELSRQLQLTIEELQEKNEQLKRDIQYISKVDEKRKEFMSSVSHELKTPIALIKGYAEGLQEKVVETEEDRAYYYHVIIDEAERMSTLVRKLMTLNNLESGHDDLILEPFDLVFLAQVMLKRSQRLNTDQEISFEFSGPKEAIVLADEFLIEEVVLNYLTNAIHHASGEKLIWLHIKEEEEQVYLSVYNTGSPLTEEDKERIWDSFYKVDKSRSRAYGGNGLGLAVVKAIMERHESDYGVENIEGGVRFWIRLPAVKSLSEN